MKRRRFLKGAAALFVAPAIVRADSLMKIWVPPEPRFGYYDNVTWYSNETPDKFEFGVVYSENTLGRVDDLRYIETPSFEIIGPDEISFNSTGVFTIS